MGRITVLHENSPWVDPLRSAFDELGLPYTEWFLDNGSVPFDRPPPEGVFYIRMSASSHTRGHRYGPELTHATLTWLESHGRRVVKRSPGALSGNQQTGAVRRLEAGRCPGRQGPLRRSGATTSSPRHGSSPPFPSSSSPNRGGKGLGRAPVPIDRGGGRLP